MTYAPLADWNENGTVTLPAVTSGGEPGRRRRPADSRRLGLLFAFLAAICVSVILSVITTIFVLSAAESGVLLPKYAQYNQPTQISQLGFCVERKNATFHIWTAQNAGFCYGGRFVRVTPDLKHP